MDLSEYVTLTNSIFCSPYSCVFFKIIYSKRTVKHAWLHLKCVFILFVFFYEFIPLKIVTVKFRNVSCVYNSFVFVFHIMHLSRLDVLHSQVLVSSIWGYLFSFISVCIFCVACHWNQPSTPSTINPSTPQNGQTPANNSSTTSNEFIECFWLFCWADT